MALKHSEAVGTVPNCYHVCIYGKCIINVHLLCGKTTSDASYGCVWVEENLNSWLKLKCWIFASKLRFLVPRSLLTAYNDLRLTFLKLDLEMAGYIWILHYENHPEMSWEEMGDIVVHGDYILWSEYSWYKKHITQWSHNVETVSMIVFRS